MRVSFGHLISPSLVGVPWFMASCSMYAMCLQRPWDVMMMLFSELYTMLVPLFLPDRHWIARLPDSEAYEEGFQVFFAHRQVSTMLWSLRYSDQNWWHIRARNVKTPVGKKLLNVQPHECVADTFWIS